MTDRLPGTIGDSLHRAHVGAWGRDYAKRFLGALGLFGDSLAQAMVDAWASTIQTRGDGPAYDALRLLGKEFSIPQTEIESWTTYAARISNPWKVWAEAGTDAGIINQLAAIGFPGATIVATTEKGSDYDFNVVFPEGTHSVTTYGATYGDGSLYGDGTTYGPGGITGEELRSMRSIVVHFKPAHWRALFFVFERAAGDVTSGIQVTI